MKASEIQRIVDEKLKKLEALFGKKIPQRHRKAFITAITHSSFSGEYKNFSSNEKLEFLGDSVLSLAITHYLITHYKEFQEGDLSKKRAFIVSEKSLAEKGLELNIGEIILFGKGEIKTGGRCKKAVLADTFESIIAAVLATTAHAQNCRSDGLGGYRCDDGNSIRPDGLGGWRDSNGNTSRPDGLGGYRHSDGTSTRSDGLGGYRNSDGSSSRPDGLGGYRNSDGTACRPDGLGGFRCN